jgi:hypothetical protein
MGQRNERIRGLDANHISICKLTDQDPNWQIVLARFEAIAQEQLANELVYNLPHTAHNDADRESSHASLERRLRALEPHRC